MKKTMLFFTLIVTSFMVAQDVNTKKGYAAEGYDVVAYFASAAKEGKKKYMTTYEGVNYKFSSEQNLNTFMKTLVNLYRNMEATVHMPWLKAEKKLD